MSARARARARTMLLVGVAAISVAACAGVDGATSTQPPEPTRDEAASAYKALVGPLNARLRDLGTRVDAAHGLAEMADISLGYADVEDAFRVGLLALDVPMGLRDEAQAAADAAERVAALNRDAAAAARAGRPMGSQLGAALDNQRVWLGRLREGLGLGPVPAGGREP